MRLLGYAPARSSFFSESIIVSILTIVLPAPCPRRQEARPSLSMPHMKGALVSIVPKSTSRSRYCPKHRSPSSPARRTSKGSVLALCAAPKRHDPLTNGVAGQVEVLKPVAEDQGPAQVVHTLGTCGRRKAGRCVRERGGGVHSGPASHRCC